MQLGGLTAGAMFQWDVARNDSDDGYDSIWRASGFVQRLLVLGISVYGEAALEANSGGGSTGQMGVGALWQLTTRLRLDYELLRGLNRHAAEWTPVLRVNWEW